MYGYGRTGIRNEPKTTVRHLFFSAFCQYTVCLCPIKGDGVCSRSCISRSCCWWPDTFCYSVMARKKQPAWERTSSTSKEWLDTVGGVCHPVWKRATLVYPANTERSEFRRKVFFSGEGICGGLGLMYCSVVKPDTCKWLSFLQQVFMSQQKTCTWVQR